MPRKTASKRAKIPQSVVKRLSRELAAFGPDLQVPRGLITLTPVAEQLGAIAGESQRRSQRRATAPVLFSLDSGTPAGSWWDRKREALLKRAAELRDKYRNNPYIEVKGFSIEIGVSLSLAIDFEFK